MINHPIHLCKYTYFHIPGELWAGCCEYSSSAYLTPNLDFELVPNHPQNRQVWYPLPEEIAKLCCRVNFRLPSILPLTSHRQCHDIITVFCRDQIGSLEEDASPVRPGHGRPVASCGECSFNGSFDIGFRRFGVIGDWLMGCGVQLLGDLRGCDLVLVSAP